LRRFTDDLGAPLVSGFHAVGDAHTATNPLYGRGATLALVQAALLVDALAAHGSTAGAAAAYEAASRAEIEPWYHASMAADAAVARAESLVPHAADEDDELGRLLRMDVWIDAVFHDMSLAPKVALLLNLLRPATEVLADGGLVEAFRAAADRRDRDIAARAAKPGRVSRTDVLAAA
jgi:flavin-dependent dehydrogenase